MSLETWKAEFYEMPVVTEDGQPNVPANEAVAHSIKKWQGLTEENLKKHRLYHDCGTATITEETAAGADLNAGESFGIDAATCALCVHYIDSRITSDESEPSKCETCPLSIARGGASCDAISDTDDDDSPYDTWVDTTDPQPMLDALAAAAKYEANLKKEDTNAESHRPSDQA